jgi:hypothetical protein
MSKERAMTKTLIRYKAKPELADGNAELVSAVFAELKAVGPDGVRYQTEPPLVRDVTVAGNYRMLDES